MSKGAERFDRPLGSVLDRLLSLGHRGEATSVESLAEKVDLPVGDGRFGGWRNSRHLRLVVAEE